MGTIDDGGDLWPVERRLWGGKCSECRDVGLHADVKCEVEVIVELGHRNADGFTEGNNSLKATVLELENVGSASDILVNHPL